MEEQIINLTFNQGGIRNPIAGLSKDEMKQIAKAVRPEISFTGVMAVKVADNCVLREEVDRSGGGLLAQAGAIKRWMPVYRFLK
jgi:hypothetical protein